MHIYLNHLWLLVGGGSFKFVLRGFLKPILEVIDGVTGSHRSGVGKTLRDRTLGMLKTFLVTFGNKVSFIDNSPQTSWGMSGLKDWMRWYDAHSRGSHRASWGL